MALYRLFLLILIPVCGGLLVSCGESGPTKVDGISIALDESGKTGDTVASLKPQDNPFHTIIHLNKSGPEEMVRMDFVAIGADNGNDLTVLTETYDVNGLNNQVDFTISMPRPWPVGSYRIEAYLDDSLSMAREFQVME